MQTASLVNVLIHLAGLLYITWPLLPGFPEPLWIHGSTPSLDLSHQLVGLASSASIVATLCGYERDAGLVGLVLQLVWAGVVLFNRNDVVKVISPQVPFGLGLGDLWPIVIHTVCATSSLVAFLSSPRRVEKAGRGLLVYVLLGVLLVAHAVPIWFDLFHQQLPPFLRQGVAITSWPLQPHELLLMTLVGLCQVPGAVALLLALLNLGVSARAAAVHVAAIRFLWLLLVLLHRYTYAQVLAVPWFLLVTIPAVLLLLSLALFRVAPAVGSQGRTESKKAK
jgi:hypothetical protein